MVSQPEHAVDEAPRGSKARTESMEDGPGGGFILDDAADASWLSVAGLSRSSLKRREIWHVTVSHSVRLSDFEKISIDSAVAAAPQTSNSGLKRTLDATLETGTNLCHALLPASDAGGYIPIGKLRRGTLSLQCGLRELGRDTPNLTGTANAETQALPRDGASQSRSHKPRVVAGKDRKFRRPVTPAPVVPGGHPRPKDVQGTGKKRRKLG